MIYYKVGKSKDTKTTKEKFNEDFLKGGYDVLVVSDVETKILKNGAVKYRIRKED